nr:MAG TPA: hypothetical protein [Caudoviricetes sp.]
MTGSSAVSRPWPLRCINIIQKSMRSSYGGSGRCDP